MNQYYDVYGEEDPMQDAILAMSQELAAEIVEEVKMIDGLINTGTLSQSQLAGELATKRALNSERIKALGLFLIEGGKYE